MKKLKLFTIVPVPCDTRRSALTICLFIIFLSSFAVRSYAQEAGELDAALGIEANNNSPNGAAGGASLALQYSFFDWLSAGLKQEVSYNFNSVMTSETSATFRWTFLRPAGIPLFAEGFAGLSSIKELHARLAYRFLGGAGVGARFNIGAFYIEPQLSFGWPRLWGAGVSFNGFRLPKFRTRMPSPDKTENMETSHEEPLTTAPPTEIARTDEGFNAANIKTPDGIDLSRAGAVPEGVTWVEETKTYTVLNDGLARAYRVYYSDSEREPPGVAEHIEIAAGVETTLMFDDAALAGGLTVNDGAKLTLRSIGAECDRPKVLVPAGTAATVVLDGVNFAGSAPISVLSGGKLTLLLNGENAINSNDGAGIHVPAGAELIIESASVTGSDEGFLSVEGEFDAGIGGNDREDGGTITINGGTIEAAGGGAGIGGGGRGGTGGTIAITGGNVRAKSTYGAGIGGGNGGKGAGGWSAGGTIAIAGGNVRAESAYGAGIGGGNGGDGGNITITGGVVISGVKESGGAGIGGGNGGNGGAISISGNALVYASVNDADSSNAAIGAGDRGNCGKVVISGGLVVAAVAGSTAPSIGNAPGVSGGSIAISGGTVIANGSIGLSGKGGLSPVTISGSPVIFAAGVNDCENAPTNGIVIGEGIVSASGSPDIATAGAVTVPEAFAVPANGVLSVPKGWTIVPAPEPVAPAANEEQAE